ncbi:prophage endopeptidase tail family protein [Companilactobacillus nodensis]|uniref:Prophage Lp2 protein 50 n=1 Tax=Companilactobacillus nodensis DSM 19682 = JCM 14932 = NBRC 107160 TaxID=1423775 RepID=A0A0R1K5Q5_9LACO|nr:prophage endopeptidase tail family protein [Companilactobacillus nodensis]KRK78752.1 prophage Lp2 protein 50 [Companilactobacillus nodensis DSM 19682 = JCM 14932 = NBRC 107160]
MIKFDSYRVQDKDGVYDETLTCIDRDSLSNSIEMNKSDQIDFTAVNDESIGYQLLQNENYIIFDGQKYRIKQAEKDDEAYDLKRTVSATHIWFDCQYVYNYDKINGTKKLSASDLMSFIFDQNELGNHGFTWKVQGSTETATFTDYGEKSGLECINDCIEKFNLVVIANNKNITLIPLGKWQHKTDKSFRYIHDTPTFTANIDTTEIQNIARVYGKTNAPVTSPIGTAVGTISFMNGAPVVDDPNKPTNTVQTLPNGTKWVMDSKVVANGETWYRVSTNGWVNEKYIVFDKNGDIQPENHIITEVTGQGTIKTSTDSDKENTSSGNSLPIGNAVGTVSFVGGAPALSDPQKQDSIVNHLDNGTTWAINNKRVINDTIYYEVATNQWVDAKYISFDKDGNVKPEDHTINPVTGQGTVKAEETDSNSTKDSDDKTDESSDDDSDTTKSDSSDSKESNIVYVYDSPFTPQNKTGRTLSPSSQWRVSASVSDGAQGKSWYKVGTNEWVPQDQLDFSGKTDVSPGDVTPTESIIYDSPWTPQHEVGRKLSDGTQWKINGEITDGANGKTWYRVATNEWVCADNFVFTGDTDVEPTEVNKGDDDAAPDDHSTDYFQPFIIRDEKSISEWGERPGPAITNNDIEDPIEMRKYALSQMKTEPTVDITLTYSGDNELNIGDMIYCDIQPENFTTWVTVVSSKYNPLSYSNSYEINLNSTPQTLSDYELSIQTSLANARYNAAISLSNGSITNPWLTTKVGEV